MLSRDRNKTVTGPRCHGEAGAEQTSYRYGPYNVLEEITDPKGSKLRFQYDSKEQLTCVTNQMGLHWIFERDPIGRVVRETDFDGRTLHYGYDAYGDGASVPAQ